MDWREVRTDAAKKARQAEALYLEEDGDLKLADELAAEATELFEKAEKLEALEKISLPEPAPPLTTRKAEQLREAALSFGFSEDQVKAMFGAVDGPIGKPGKVAGYEQPSDSLKALGDFLGCIYYNNKARLKSVYGSEFDADAFKAESGAPFPWVKDLLESGGTSGGYLVPTEQVNELLKVPESQVIVRPLAWKMPMRSRSLRMPMLDQDGTPTAYWDLQYYGGVYASWTEEAGTKTETEPAFKQLELVAHKLAGYTQASDELLADSAVGLAALIQKLFGGAINMREDFGFLRGTGAGMPLGVLNSAALKTQNRATANTISYNDLTRMAQCMLPSSFGNAVWLLDLTALGAVLRITDAGSNAAFIVNANGGVVQRIPGTIFGRPVIVTEKLPTLGSTGDLMLVDLSYYVIGDRQATTIASSEHYAFVNDLTTWRFVHRVDGQPWLDAPIYIDTSNTVSPFVALHANTTS